MNTFSKQRNLKVGQKKGQTRKGTKMKDHVPKKRLLPHHHNLNFAEWRNATSDKEQPKQACPALLGTIAIFLLKAQQLKLKIKMSNKLKKNQNPKYKP